MDFKLTEEQMSIRAMARQFCKREVKWEKFKEIMQNKNPRDRLPWDLIEKLDKVGLRNLAIPKKYGGGEAGWLTRLVVGEELARGGGPLGSLMTAHWKWCADLAAVGTPEQQDEFFPKIMKNTKAILAITITEPDAGSDSMLPYDEPGVGMKTFAYKDGEDWVINGVKHFCSGGGVADYLIVYARTAKDKPLSESVTTFIVPTNTKGFSVARINDLMEMPMRANADLLFEDVRIPDKYRMSEVNKGYRNFYCRRAGKLIHLGPQIGYAQRIYDLTKEYAKNRVQGGKPIYEHKNIGPLVVEMQMIIEAARLMAYKSAWKYDQMNTPWVDPMYYNLANAFWKNMSLRTCEIVAEVFAGMAVMKELPIEGYIRATYTWLHGGSTANMNLIKCMQSIEDFVPTGCD